MDELAKLERMYTRVKAALTGLPGVVASFDRDKLVITIDCPQWLKDKRIG